MKMDEERYKGFDIWLEPDEDAESPREYDNLGTMVCFHRRYNLGDKHSLSANMFVGWDEVEGYLRNEKHAVLVLPLYLYDHSGLRIKVGSFDGLLPQGHAEFDSGMVGFIYVSREKLLAEYGGSRVSKKKLADAEKVLRSEVAVYDTYLRGGFVGYVVEKDGEHIDSCWGIDDPTYALTCAREAVDAEIAKAA